MSIRSERIQFFRKILLDFLKKSGRSELPWRKKGMTAYSVWVSEVMLQQTQVSRVIGYYERFLRRFPDVNALAQASWEEFLPYYEGLGYYARERNMLKAAQYIAHERAGEFPKTLAELETLPGIGPYTARAIASFAYGAKHLAWDTNLRRVVGRFFLGSRTAIDDKAMQFWDGALGKDAKALNAALMDFGSALCTARPKCANCPLQKKCRYYRERGAGETGTFTGVKPSSKPKGAVTSAIVFLHERHQRYFSSQKRVYRPFFLPRGSVTRPAIKAFFKERYGLTVSVRPPHRRVQLRGELVELVNGQILQGEAPFKAFPKSAVVEYTKREIL